LIIAEHRGMHEQNRAAPVHLGIDRLELRLGDRPPEARDVHVDPAAAEFVQPTRHPRSEASI
jgi:hypothetical protein